MISAQTRLLGATSVMALTILAAPVFAQDDILGTVILGELQTRTSQDSPTSAVVELGYTLEERGDADVYDLIERAPNVSTTYGNKGFVLRGMQTNGAVNNVQLNGTLVSVQVDGVALNNYQSTFFGPYSSWDVAQIEVLRGPQSTQQGRNAMAGAVIYRSQDTEFFQEYRLRTELGSRNLQRYAFAVNEPLGDAFALRVVGELSSEDGWVRSETRNDDLYDARNYESFRAKLRWQPNDAFDAVLAYSYTDSSGGEDYVLESAFPARRITDDTADAVEGSVHRNLGLRMTYDISDTMTLESETNFYQQDYRRLEGDADPLGPNASRATYDGNSETFEQDVQLSFETGRFSGVAGVFYTDTSDSRPYVITTELTNFGAPGMSDFADLQFTTDVQNFAIYAETDIDLNDYVAGLTATVGARYDMERYSFSRTVAFGPLLSTQLPPVTPASGERDFDAFLPKLGLTYEMDENQSVSFTAQRAYRAGGVAYNFVEGTFFAGPPLSRTGLSDYDPEYSNTYELAYRGSFNDDTLRISGNVFYTQWTDMQISVPGIPTQNVVLDQFNFNTANAAEAELYGFELAVEAEPSDNLDLWGGIGYTQTQFLNFQSGEFNAAGGVTPVDYSGNAFPFAPEWTANIGGKYHWDNGFALAMDMSYKSESFQDNANTYTDDARVLVNAHATYDLTDNVTAGVYVRNLFDEDFATARYDAPAPSTAPTIIRTGEPRTFGFYVQADF